MSPLQILRLQMTLKSPADWLAFQQALASCSTNVTSQKVTYAQTIFAASAGLSASRTCLAASVMMERPTRLTHAYKLTTFRCNCDVWNGLGLSA